jgi:hypothetical protein
MQTVSAGAEPGLSADRAELLRAYAAGAVSWTTLRRRGFEDYVEVLAGLGVLGLRPPTAPMTGPNRAARARGREWLRQALRRQEQA